MEPGEGRKPLSPAEVQRRLGRIYLARGKRPEAARAWREALRLEPGDRELAGRLADLERELAAPDVTLPPARLVAVHENELVEEIPVSSAVLNLGADPVNDVVIRGSRVSPRHARIVYREGSYWIEDLGSAYGTQLDGQAVHGSCPLRHESHIRLGSSLLKFLAGSA